MKALSPLLLLVLLAGCREKSYQRFVQVPDAPVPVAFDTKTGQWCRPIDPGGNKAVPTCLELYKRY